MASRKGQRLAQNAEPPAPNAASATSTPAAPNRSAAANAQPKAKQQQPVAVAAPKGPHAKAAAAAPAQAPVKQKRKGNKGLSGTSANQQNPHPSAKLSYAIRMCFAAYQRNIAPDAETSRGGAGGGEEFVGLPLDLLNLIVTYCGERYVYVSVCDSVSKPELLVFDPVNRDTQRLVGSIAAHVSHSYAVCAYRSALYACGHAPVPQRLLAIATSELAPHHAPGSGKAHAAAKQMPGAAAAATTTSPPIDSKQPGSVAAAATADAATAKQVGAAASDGKSTFVSYAPLTRKWQAHPEPPLVGTAGYGRYGASVVCAMPRHHALYVLGGCDALTGDVVDTVLRFDFVEKAWDVMPQEVWQLPRRSHCAAYDAEGDALYVFGGESGRVPWDDHRVFAARDPALPLYASTMADFEPVPHTTLRFDLSATHSTGGGSGASRWPAFGIAAAAAAADAKAAAAPEWRRGAADVSVRGVTVPGTASALQAAAAGLPDDDADVSAWADATWDAPKHAVRRVRACCYGRGWTPVHSVGLPFPMRRHAACAIWSPDGIGGNGPRYLVASGGDARGVTYDMTNGGQYEFKHHTDASENRKGAEPPGDASSRRRERLVKTYGVAAAAAAPADAATDVKRAAAPAADAAGAAAGGGGGAAAAALFVPERTRRYRDCREPYMAVPASQWRAGGLLLNVVNALDLRTVHDAYAEWTSLGAMTAARRGHTMDVVDTQLYVFGGYYSTYMRAGTDTYVHALSKWQAVTHDVSGLVRTAIL